MYSTWVSRGRTLPILTEVTHTVTAVPVTLTLLSALRNPFGKPFKVTDKGGDHSAINVNVPTATLFGSLSLMLSFILLFNLLGPGAQAEPAPRDIFNMGLGHRCDPDLDDGPRDLFRTAAR